MRGDDDALADDGPFDAGTAGGLIYCSRADPQPQQHSTGIKHIDLHVYISLVNLSNFAACLNKTSFGHLSDVGYLI